MEMAIHRQCKCFCACKRGDLTGPDPTNRAKLGTKRHIHTDTNGIPLATVISAANAHDKTQLCHVLQTPVISRPSPKTVEQHLCLDKGYDYQDIRKTVKRRGYIGHIPKRGQESATRTSKKGKARRWVVERTNRWHNLFRRLKIRYEVHAQNYLGFLQFACAIICFRAARAA